MPLVLPLDATPSVVLPTFTDERAGVEKGTAEYSRMMNEYQRLFIEDLHKMTDDLKKYERFKNQLPQDNLTTGVGVGSIVGSGGGLGGNFGTTAGCVWHKSAVGTVKLLDLSTEMEYSARHQGTLLVAKYAAGHGVLRPEASLEIKTA